MADVVAKLATENAGMTFVNIEAENFPDICEKYPMTAVPTFVVLQGGKQVDIMTGADVGKLVTMVGKYAKAAARATPAPATDDLTARLKQLVKAAPVMLFMKGQPDAPKCGFSRKTVAALREQDVKFGYFDILTDDDVRQGLKTLSNWKTYPQLYINGELIGGLDVLKELIDEGEFKALLPKAANAGDLKKRLQALVSQKPFMLFMKGNPAEPKCGFSRTTVALLNEHGFDYGTFDILLDDEVRQGLKSFSNWPTYPQFYHNGDLVGGLDVLKEMAEDGDLADLLSAK